MSIEKVFLRTEFNYDRDKASDESGLCCKDPSLTQQGQKEDTDINVIVRRFGLTGQLPQNVRVPLAEDFIDSMDFHDAQNAIRLANESFMAMPADVRSRFENDAGKFVDFCIDPRNIEEMRKLGLAVPAALEGVQGAEPPGAPASAPG